MYREQIRTIDPLSIFHNKGLLINRLCPTVQDDSRHRHIRIHYLLFLLIATDFKLRESINHYTKLSDVDAIACVVPLLFGRVDADLCGGLTPTASSVLKTQWKTVQYILETTSIRPKAIQKGQSLTKFASPESNK
jgi:hypothetical protein